MANPRSVAIVGGGFSGLMTAAQIIRQATGPLVISIIEPAEELGLGLAYSTPDHAHLLNVRANRMGAWAAEPGDFWQWVQSSPHMKSDWSGESFLPRAVYAHYLRSIRDKMHHTAQEKGIAVTHRRDAARRILKSGNGFEVELQKDRLPADTVVLASGNPIPQPAALVKGADQLGPQYLLPSAWHAEALAERAPELATQECLFILGAGLTMVDTVLTLEQAGYRGKYVVLSRHGHLPLPHVDGLTKTWKAMWPENVTASARAYLRALRSEVAAAAQEGVDWRLVIDALRPHTVPLWQRLPETEKKRFLRHLFGLWNIHRHRMAPEIWERIRSLAAQGRLQQLRGRVMGVSSTEEGICVAYRPRSQTITEELAAGGILLCAGPGYDFRRGGSELYRALLADGLAEAHPSGAGICLSSEAKGLYALGTPLIGERLETTAVPELRDQAQEMAQRVLAG